MYPISDVENKDYQMAPQYRIRGPENYDIDNNYQRLDSFPEEETEPELYCFEDFIPSDDQYNNTEYPTEVTCLSCVNNNKKRQLHRSKTLPIIHSPIQCTEGDELPGCQHMVQGAAGPRWSNRSPDSSEYSGSCGSESGRRKSRSRKYRVRSLSRERKTQRRTSRGSGSSDQKHQLTSNEADKEYSIRLLKRHSNADMDTNYNDTSSKE